MALYFHCGAHVSYLIASKAINESTIIRNYLNTVQDLGSLYNQSGKLKQLFQNNENNVIKPLCQTIFLTRELSVSCIINNYTDIINNLDEYCKNGMASGKSTGILANMKSPLFIVGISMVFPIISMLEKCNVMLQSRTITVSLMISSSKSVIQKLQECRE